MYAEAAAGAFEALLRAQEVLAASGVERADFAAPLATSLFRGVREASSVLGRDVKALRGLISPLQKNLDACADDLRQAHVVPHTAMIHPVQRVSCFVCLVSDVVPASETFFLVALLHLCDMPPFSVVLSSHDYCVMWWHIWEMFFVSCSFLYCGSFDVGCFACTSWPVPGRHQNGQASTMFRYR